ncbi:MAG: phosphatidylinositol mannoside acyltransferase [Micromonosporaceae bacterium]|nr:phosphatidylinositol mannoside acyltransferase [Micromonosporaceae bacterium]
MKDELVEGAYAAGWRVVRMLPAPVAAGLFQTAADLLYLRRHRSAGLAQLAANLRRVVGPDLPADEFDDLLRRAVRSYARYWMEAFRLPSLSREDFLTQFLVDNEEVLAEPADAGRGVILTLPHSANWDLAGAWVVTRGWPLVSVAERLRPEGLYERFVAYRRSLGMEIIPLTGGEQPPFDVLVNRLRAGYVVALLADRDLPGRGAKVDFFGSQTRMPPGPALLALRTGAPLVAVELWYDERVTRARLHPVPLPGPEEGTVPQRARVATQRMADRFAEAIARHPHDWHMLQRVWQDIDARGGRSSAPLMPTGHS